MVNHYYRFHVCFSVLCKHCQQARNIIIISLAWILNEELNTLSMIYKKQRPKSEQDRTFFSLDLKPCPKVSLFRSNLWSANFSQKTNGRICFVCFFTLHDKQIKFVRSSARQSAFWFYLTFSLQLIKMVWRTFFSQWIYEVFLTKFSDSLQHLKICENRICCFCD